MTFDALSVAWTRRSKPFQMMFSVHFSSEVRRRRRSALIQLWTSSVVAVFGGKRGRKSVEVFWVKETGWAGESISWYEEGSMNGWGDAWGAGWLKFSDTLSADQGQIKFFPRKNEHSKLWSHSQKLWKMSTAIFVETYLCLGATSNQATLFKKNKSLLFGKPIELGNECWMLNVETSYLYYTIWCQ